MVGVNGGVLSPDAESLRISAEESDGILPEMENGVTSPSIAPAARVCSGGGGNSNTRPEHNKKHNETQNGERSDVTLNGTGC